MLKQERLLAEPVSRILLLDTAELVGWIYRWNNGDVQEAWLNGPRSGVYHQPLAREGADELPVVAFSPETQQQKPFAKLG